MKSFIRVHNLNTQNDVVKIKEIISQYEGIIACEISISKKEIQLVYDRLSISIDEIESNIEMEGYMII